MITTFYLKYRPQKFQDLDSTEAREELEKVFGSGKFPHAFLFSGPKGIGKTSAARIVAKAVNCEEVQRCKGTKVQSEDHEPLNLGRKAADEPLNLYEPCNKCASCISITNGTNVDVLEIDAASNRGIDDIKELREKIKLSPASSKYKVYIIDEVHMLTAEAFNALLKTLEEPPAHAIFILCTTDPEKLPKTITSRCQRINFKRANKKEIVERLKSICKEEKLSYQDKALMAIAKLSDGSFRDANKLLEQVSLSGEVTEKEVEKTAGISGEFKIEDFLKLLQKEETKEALSWIGKAAEQGVNLKILLERVLDALRILLLTRFGIEEEKDLLEEEYDFSVEEIRSLINLFTRAYSELRFAVIPQLPLEMAVIEWSENQFKAQSFGSSQDKSSKFKVDEEEKDGDKGKTQRMKDFRPNEDKVTSVKPLLDEKLTPTGNFTLNDVLSRWSEILEKVKPMNHSVLAFLKACRPIACEENFLVLEVFYKFHKDQLEKEQCRRIFEKAATEVLGVEVKLRCNLGQRQSVVIAPPPPPPIISQPQGEDDIISLAEEIFSKGGTIQ